jgi:hypothetical protein
MYLIARRIADSLSFSIPMAALHNIQSAPRTLPLSWQWSIATAFRKRQIGHTPSPFSASNSAGLTPYFDLRWLSHCRFRSAARDAGCALTRASHFALHISRFRNLHATQRCGAFWYRSVSPHFLQGRPSYVGRDVAIACVLAQKAPVAKIASPGPV